MEDDENRIFFIKDVEITDGKTFTIYSVLRTETEKCAVIECLDQSVVSAPYSGKGNMLFIMATTADKADSENSGEVVIFW